MLTDKVSNADIKKVINQLHDCILTLTKALRIFNLVSVNNTPSVAAFVHVHVVKATITPLSPSGYPIPARDPIPSHPPTFTIQLPYYNFSLFFLFNLYYTVI